MVYVQKWFMSKINMENRNFEFTSRSGEIIKETEKAYLLAFEACTIDGEWDGMKHIWVPKKCTMSEEEYRAELEAAVKRFEEGCRSYDQLIEYAKSHGVAVRKGMRTATIEQKMREAGVTYA